MREAELLFLLALGFHLFESLVRVPLGAEVMVRPWRRWRRRPPFVLRSGAGPAFALAPPHQPFAILAVGDPAGGDRDRAAVQARVAEFAKITARLRMLQTLLAVSVFLGGGLLVWWEKLQALPTFIMMAELWLLVIIEGVLVRRAWKLPEPPPWREVVVALSSPIAAMHVHSVLGRRLLRGYDKLTVASALLPSEAMAEVLRPALARARFAGDGDVAALEALATESGLEPATLLAAPERESEQALAYCPVCRAQFTRADGGCESCGGVTLQPLA